MRLKVTTMLSNDLSLTFRPSHEVSLSLLFRRRLQRHKTELRTVRQSNHTSKYNNNSKVVIPSCHGFFQCHLKKRLKNVSVNGKQRQLTFRGKMADIVHKRLHLPYTTEQCFYFLKLNTYIISIKSWTILQQAPDLQLIGCFISDHRMLNKGNIQKCTIMQQQKASAVTLYL